MGGNRLIRQLPQTTYILVGSSNQKVAPIFYGRRRSGRCADQWIRVATFAARAVHYKVLQSLPTLAKYRRR